MPVDSICMYFKSVVASLLITFDVCQMLLSPFVDSAQSTNLKHQPSIIIFKLPTPHVSEKGAKIAFTSASREQFSDFRLSGNGSSGILLATSFSSHF